MGNQNSSTSTPWPDRPLPAVYRLVVSGRLASTWVGRLGEMRVTVHESADGARTVVEGPVRDRAELTGILNTLNDLHLTLLSVEVVEDQP